MLDTCYAVACSVYLQFNVHKCHCMVVGKMYKFAISSVSLAGQEIKWCDQVKYLGIYLARGKALKFDVLYEPIEKIFLCCLQLNIFT